MHPFRPFRRPPDFEAALVLPQAARPWRARGPRSDRAWSGYTVTDLDEVAADEDTRQVTVDLPKSLADWISRQDATIDDVIAEAVALLVTVGRAE